jgi:hypothetical protein
VKYALLVAGLLLLTGCKLDRLLGGETDERPNTSSGALPGCGFSKAAVCGDVEFGGG